MRAGLSPCLRARQMCIVEMPAEAIWLALDLGWGSFSNLAVQLVGVARRILSHQLEKGQRNSTQPTLFLALDPGDLPNRSDFPNFADEETVAQRENMAHSRPHR